MRQIDQYRNFIFGKVLILRKGVIYGKKTCLNGRFRNFLAKQFQQFFFLFSNSSFFLIDEGQKRGLLLQSKRKLMGRWEKWNFFFLFSPRLFSLDDSVL